jgi:hypothetical protein
LSSEQGQWRQQQGGEEGFHDAMTSVRLESPSLLLLRRLLRWKNAQSCGWPTKRPARRIWRA